MPVNVAMNQLFAVDGNGQKISVPIFQGIDNEYPNKLFKMLNRRYVEQYMFGRNTDEAFEALIADCEANDYIACAHGKYTITKPIVIGNINVDFSASTIYTTTAETAIWLTGAQSKRFLFGAITSKAGSGIKVETTVRAFGGNYISADLMVCEKFGLYTHCITGHPICFNRFDCQTIRTSGTGIYISADIMKGTYNNEWHMMVNSIEPYFGVDPDMMIYMHKTTRCNIYNLSIEHRCKECAIMLSDVWNCEFYNIRSEEGNSAIHVKLDEMCHGNVFEGGRWTKDRIDTSTLVTGSFKWNMFRGAILDRDKEADVNVEGLAVYDDAIVPDKVYQYTRKVTEDYTVGQNFENGENEWLTLYPTTLLWSGGDITVNPITLTRCRTNICIIKTGDHQGAIKDTDGNVLFEASQLGLNKPYTVIEYERTLSERILHGSFQNPATWITSVKLALLGDTVIVSQD